MKVLTKAHLEEEVTTEYLKAYINKEVTTKKLQNYNLNFFGSFLKVLSRAYIEKEVIRVLK